jgi:hypothetical protein
MLFQPRFQRAPGILPGSVQTKSSSSEDINALTRQDAGGTLDLAPRFVNGE